MATKAKVDRSYSHEYLKEQHGAMRWLAEQGIDPEDIRVFSFGNIDETKRELRVLKTIHTIRLDRKNGVILTADCQKWVKIPAKDSPFYDFFIKKKFPSCFLFTKERPKSWRREEAEKSLYSLSDIQMICGNKSLNDPLTKTLEFDTIRVTKLNITNLKAKEQIEYRLSTSVAKD